MARKGKVVRKHFSKKTRKHKRSPIKWKNMVDLGLGFPKKILMTHKYSEITSLTSTTGVGSVYLWSCNGMYDPNYTGAGHQPYLFDQCAALYDHYCVIGSKITLKITPSTSGAVAHALTVFVNDDTSVTSSSVDLAAEMQSGRLRVVPAGMTDKATILTSKWSAKKYFGKSPLANSELQGTSGANPTEQSFFTLYLQAMDKASTVAVYIEAMIEYIAVWKEIKDIANS